LHAIIKIFWIFVEQGEIMEAEEPTVRVGAIPSKLTAPHPHNPPGKIGLMEAEAPTVPVDAIPTETNGASNPSPHITPDALPVS